MQYIIFYKRWFIAILVLLACVKSAFTQQKIDFAKFDVRATWHVEQNNYQGKPVSLSTLTIKTTANALLPATGWKLYFNFSRKITRCLLPDIAVTHVNGDLFYLAPKAGFKGTDKNSVLPVSFVSADWVVNYTDAPEGLFFVFDSNPQKTYPVPVTVLPSTAAVQSARIPTDKIAFTTPAYIYKQNESIQDIPSDSLIKMFPTPYDYKLTDGEFTLTQKLVIKADTQFTGQLPQLKSMLLKKLGVNALDETASTNSISLNYNSALQPEAYDLEVTDTRIGITASTPAGMYYGLQSLFMVLQDAPASQPVMLHAMQVSDKPRFGYRAVMLDVARNFQPKQQVKKLIDLMGLYKLNKLHFHLTDDEGWRLDIKELPELTEVGGKRGYDVTGKYLAPALGSGPDVDNKTGTGFYTREDFIEILKYAKTHYIEVIPEIESPGHARAAIKAMDVRYNRFMKQSKPDEASRYMLRDLADSSRYLSVQMYNDNVINVALPSAYTFMQTVTDDIISMYREAGAPLTTIHFGGDEVPAGVWERSPAVKQLLQKNTAIGNVDDLWSYYYNRLHTMLKERNLHLTAWEEVGLKKKLQGKTKINVLNDNMVGKDVHLEVWNNLIGWGAEDLAYRLANNGYKVILSCVTNLYFDMAYEKNFDEPGYYWGGYTDIDDAFKFIPLDYLKNVQTDRFGNPLNKKYVSTREKLTGAGVQNIVGIQGALWAETIKSTGQMEYMILPKLLGLAERAWSKNPQWATERNKKKSAELYAQAFSKFINTVSKQQLPLLDTYADGFNYRIPQPGAVVKNNAVVANSKYKGFVIRYTVDGSEPDSNSAVYKGPITANGTIRLRLFNHKGRGGKSIAISNGK
ncbi:beta-N-acetylhexosaminidase [Mucilaginibacter hurinus]|uniref:beta-N-acetylhexosaminidase n=1 Tax=Mucilaginibacter hurinus TaxID=2201324 RepID=A0A367GL53_9SPHI|nr:family 20 glycosylhydrolase [Mucilaginibacter hurinus]RCH54207.1 beta-N-acetylhexosaminidase [Mucilaginibacter hurinus]